MATYKPVDIDQLEADLTTVADAIRAKAGTTEKMVFPAGFKSTVEAIQTGGAVIPDNARLYYIGNAESVPNFSVAFTSNAVGVLTE